MKVVLGIDAAWTAKQPSGVALVAKTSNGWRLLNVSRSYDEFHASAPPGASSQSRPNGSIPDVPRMLAAARVLAGQSVDLIAIDMPLANTRITGRRVSDNMVSKAFAARKCGTHSPSVVRPGKISDNMRSDLSSAGYKLLTTSMEYPGVVEVYPHPALVVLTGASERLKYKVSKARIYWPDEPREKRGLKLREKWREIVSHLAKEIKGVDDLMPKLGDAAAGWEMKSYEDALDAVVCAYVAICCVEGRASPFGDEDSAIWIPDAHGNGDAICARCA